MLLPGKLLEKLVSSQVNSQVQHHKELLQQQENQKDVSYALQRRTGKQNISGSNTCAQNTQTLCVKTALSMTIQAKIISEVDFCL